MKADTASFPLIRLLKPGHETLSFCRVSALGVVSPVSASSRPGPGRNSLGRQPASLTGWSWSCCQFRYAGQLIKGHSEQRSQQELAQNTHSEEIRLKQKDGSQHALLGHSSPAFLWFCDLLSQEVTRDSPLSRENRANTPCPISPAASLAFLS